MAVERKYERDIDLLLAEELSINPAFASWLQRKTKFAERVAFVENVHVSKADNLGESDLIAIYKGTNGLAFAVMIEDKVDAPLQPDQAERYRLRAAREIKLGLSDDYTVILCAPRYYLENSKGASTFDCVISFEEVAAFLREDRSPRSLYRAEFLETAGKRRANNWVREVDGLTEEFWEAAYLLASSEFPILEMKRLKVTKDSSWINFRPVDMPTMPHRIYVSVKGDRGYMDLTFTGARAHVFHDQIVRLLDPGMTIHQTGASAAIRLETPGFTPSDGIEGGMKKIRIAFESCSKLIQFYRKHRADLDLACYNAARQD